MDKGQEIMDGFWDLLNKRMWLDSYDMKQRLGDYNPSEIHCVEQIGKHRDSNVTRLAEAFSMTRSAISKLTRKLIAKDLIQSYQRPDNRKEIYFRLTGRGQEVFRIHEELHREHRERDRAVLGQVTRQQYDEMMRFVADYRAHLDAEIEKLGVDAKTVGYDRL